MKQKQKKASSGAMVIIVNILHKELLPKWFRPLSSPSERISLHSSNLLITHLSFRSTSDGRAALPPGSDDFHSADFAGLCLRETMSYLESFSPAPIHLRFSSSLTDCLSLCTSDDSSLQLIWFLHLQVYLYLQRCRIFSCKIVGIEGSIVGVDVLFPIRRSTSFGSSVRALVKIGSSAVRLRRRRSSVAWKEVVPRLDPCSLIAGRSYTWKMTCRSLLPRHLVSLPPRHLFWLFGSSPCEDWFFCVLYLSLPATSFGSSVRALVKIGSSVVRLRRRRSSVTWKEVVPRLDPCSLIAGRSYTWKMMCRSLLPRRLVSPPPPTSFGSSVRALVKIGSSVVRLCCRRSSVTWKEVVPRLDPCSLIAGRSYTWKMMCCSLFPRRFTFCVLGLCVGPSSFC
ncbi:hypothetical protein F2Q70_00001600 [Brassica cretica]|uniref:Uncharacterized protein n=1 Tax=Brassica cretica TaxID=69181 RepID=A0A8S9IYV8_BRACR|nr:hypothetical protein F2Q70_00001600 [Brassica cretica]